MAHSNPKIGKKNEYRPQETVSGRPTVAPKTGRRPNLIQRGLGNGFYCVVDIFPSVDVEEVVAQLRKEVTNANRPIKRTGEVKDDSE